LTLAPNYINMASGFFAIFDDIAALMDDVAVAAKVATRKTVGILGDDLAVNAEKATGFLSSRELPVLWAITKGSLINKLIIVPIALLLNVFFPVAIKLILVLGGFYLAYEGVEKIIEYFFHRSKAVHPPVEAVEQDPNVAEKAKIKSAVTTDFILSIEIVIIALGTVLEKKLPIQIITVSIVAVLATIGVYGIVALIVRMDDAGYKLIKRSENKGFFSILGTLLVKSLPIIIRILGVVGTIALILVAGGIFVHNIEYLHHLFPKLPSVIVEFLVGLFAGVLVVTILTGGKKVFLLLKQ
jgi:predicted DNA repair protein MutK